MKTTSILRLAIVAVLLPFAAVLSSQAADQAQAKACVCGDACKTPCNEGEKSGACAAACAKKDADKAACVDCKCDKARKTESEPAKCEDGCAK